jgi:hypothetical protein
MAHVGKAAELRGDLANASDNLSGRYWTLGDAWLDECVELIPAVYRPG